MSHWDATRFVQDRLSGFEPALGIVLGSGLGNFADLVSDRIIVDYSDVPNFPRSTVSGHQGRFVFGKISEAPVVCMQGRSHFYEGHELAELSIPVRVMHALGCETLILTNAAGSLRAEVGPGRLMLITDHINFVGVNPLIGLNDDHVGPRFFDMSNAYDLKLQELMQRVADATQIDLAKGVYAWYSGPNFETPAEIKALRVLGADAVGMSTVPECLVAVHAGMRIVAISTITNLAAGMSDTELSHNETLANAAKAAEELTYMLTKFIAEWWETKRGNY